VAECDVFKLFELIDLTSLNETDHEETISVLCQKVTMANHHVAAVCIFPSFVTTARKALTDQAVRIATVVNFPEGTDTLDTVLASICEVISHGANEVDVVFPYVTYLQGEKEKAYDFIRACKKACGEHVLLKVILETGALQDPLTIEEVSYNVCLSGADFLKTSTGKIATGATPEAARAMLTVIKKMPRPIGFKVSGGVRTVEQAMHYIQLAEDIMGPAFVTPEHFRIGASQLVDTLRERVL